MATFQGRSPALTGMFTVGMAGICRVGDIIGQGSGGEKKEGRGDRMREKEEEV